MQTDMNATRCDEELLTDYEQGEQVGFKAYATGAQMPAEFVGNKALELGYTAGIKNAIADEAIADLGH